MFSQTCTKILKAISSDYTNMTTLLEQWVNINTYSDNLPGLSQMMDVLIEEFSQLKGDINVLSLEPRQIIRDTGELVYIPSAQALHIQKRPQAPFKVFFGGHMDTVHSLANPFQKAERIDNETMKGPGVADMKGGLMIMLKTLSALENSPFHDKIGWEILINPDEELGSPGSKHLFKTCAQRNTIGLVFEPSFADGSIVSARKASANYTLISKGRKAHAGRDFFEGRNAIVPLARYITLISKLANKDKGITVNIGSIKGGEATNVVPDLAICRFNIRAWTSEEFIKLKNTLESFIVELNKNSHYQLSLFEDTFAPPKTFDQPIKSLFNILLEAADEIGLHFQVKPSGGVCDGSRLYAEGLPNIDTLGMVGGNLHTEEEYAFLPSLIQRAQLATLFVLLYANKNNYL